MWKRSILFWLIVSILVEHSSGQYKNSHIFENRTGIVHLFEWKYVDIASECQFLGENGFGGVQVSPVHESKVDDSYSWLLRYRPVSYKISSRSGSVDEFKDMIKTCLESKIRIYVDVVLNQMSDGEGEIMGSAHSVADPSKLQYPAVPYQADEFNEFCILQNYSNAFEIRNCRLVGLPDLNQGKESVREKIAAFLNELISYGIAGLRIDAVSLGFRFVAREILTSFLLIR
jgi:alpha-amylase